MSSAQQNPRKRTNADRQKILDARRAEMRRRIRASTNTFGALDTEDSPEDAAPSYTLEEVRSRMQNRAAPQDQDVAMTDAPVHTDPGVPDAPFDPSREEHPYPALPLFHYAPKALRVPCIVRMSDTGVWDFGALGSQTTNLSQYSFTFTLDFGKYAQPAFRLRLRRMKNMAKRITSSTKMDEMYEASFIWQPGVVARTVEGEVVYQLSDVSCDPLTQDNVETLSEQGLYEQDNDSKVRHTLLGSDQDRIVLINFRGSNPRIETNFGELSQMTNGVGDIDSLLMECLYKALDVKLSVIFILPKVDPGNLRGYPEYMAHNSTEFIAKEWIWFLSAYQEKWAPLWVYKNLEGTGLNVGMNMPSINFFANRMHVIYEKHTIARLNQVMIDNNGIIPVWPPGDHFHKYGKQIHFTTSDEFLTHVTGSVIRDQQWLEGEYIHFASQLITFAVVKPLRVQENEDVEMEDDRKLRQRGFFLYGYLPKDKKLRMPEVDSQWSVEFAESAFGQEIRRPKSERWTGFIKPINDEERKATGAHFVLVATRPTEGQRVAAARNIHEIKARNRLAARMIHIIDRQASERLINACSQFCHPERNDLESFRIPILYDRERLAPPPIDLTAGGIDRADWEQFSRDTTAHFLELVGEDLNIDQKNLINEELNKVYNGIKIVLGGFGCIKTSTMALIVCLMTLINHKVMIVAEDNGSINKFMKSLEEARFRLINKAAAREEQVFQNIAEGLGEQIFYRFVPPVQEKNALLDEDVGDQVHQSGRSRDSESWKGNSDAIALVAAEFELDEALAQMAADNPEMEVTRENLEAQLAQVRGDYERLESEYQRLAERCDKVNEFPARHSIVHHVHSLRQRKEDSKLKPDSEAFDVITEYEECRQIFLEGQLSPHKAAKVLRTGMDCVVSHIAAGADVVAATYVGTTHPLLRNNFTPTIVVHEEASRVRVPTALCALSYAGVKAHIFVGDKHQLPPFQSSKGKNEFSEIGETSILQMLLDKGFGHCWLAENYRNHPDIMAFPNRQWYGGRLRSNPCTSVETPEHRIFRDVIKRRYHDLDVKPSQYYFIDPANGVSHVKPGGTSLENWADAKVAAEIATAMVKAGIDARKITLQTFYRGEIEIVNTYLKANKVEGMVVTVDQYLGEDNDFVFSILTATAHKHIFRTMGGDAETYQEVSTFLKQYRRLNVAATRAKKGHLFIGSAMTLDRATTQDRDAYHLRSLIIDANKRGIMIRDDAADESPYVTNILRSDPKAAKQFAEQTSHELNLRWMAEQRETRLFNHKFPASTMQVTYGGPDQNTPTGFYPFQVRNQVALRQGVLGAVKPHETALGDGPKKKKGKPKPKGGKGR